jgi:phosphate transport system permease protein
MLTASLVLALMVLPTITAISRTALVAVPRTPREGSYAIGATRWGTIFRILVPTAAPGIVAVTILAFGRAMGETMAVAMLIGNSPRLRSPEASP